MYFEALASGGGSDWYYTILMKAPLGAAITVDDGDEEVEATGAGMDNLIGIPVHNPSSTYTISVKMNGLTAPTSSITTPATSGGISSVVEVPFAKISLTYDDNFRGQALSVSDGTHTASPSPVMPVLGNALDIYVPYTGDWTLEATDPVSGNPFNSSPNPVPVASLDQTVSAGLFVIPDGKTVLPVNNIELWLACADIKDVSYSTLEEVLADENTLRRLLTDDNAIDYLKRSTEWIKQATVPVMTDYTVPEGEVIDDDVTGANYGWKAFNGSSSDRWNTSATPFPHYLGYEFEKPVVINKVYAYIYSDNSYNWNDFKIQGSNDGFVSDINNLYEAVGETRNEWTISFNNNVAYKTYRVLVTKTAFTGNTSVLCTKMQFYGPLGITDSELAMSYIGAYDYAADTLLSDADWFDAIIKSDYVRSVFNVYPPLLSANNTAIANASSVYQNDATNYGAWKAFDGQASGLWHASATGAQWISYTFNSVKRASYTVWNCQHPERISSYKIQGYDGSNWLDLTEALTALANGKNIIQHTKNIGDYISYRLNIINSVTNPPTAHELMFLGRIDAGVQTLLKAAGVARPYTTLDELLADKEALAMVIGSHAAIDYLVTVKDWIDEFTSNEMAMLFIGGDNYAADTLLADEDWLNAIAASSYVDYVLNVSVPKMTDDTHPSGQVTYSGQYSPYAGYKAFNKDESYGWLGTSTDPYMVAGSSYIAYEFTSAVKIKACKWGFKYEGKRTSVSGRIEAFNGTNWVPVSTATSHTSETTNNYQVDKVDTSGVAYTKYRWICTVVPSSNREYGLKVQFYGREDVTEGVHIFSAASDTIYDQNNQVIATTDTSGHALVSKSNLPNGTYTLRSTVSKDPDNLSNDFTKVVKVTDNTKCIMLMPDNAIYWYGLIGSEFEECTAANGWSPSPQGFGALAYGTQGITVNNGGGTTSAGIASNKKKNNITARTIGQGVTLNSGSAGGINMKSSKSLADGGNSGEYASLTSQNVMSVSTRVSIEAHVCFASGYNRKAIVNALWYDSHNPLANFFSAANDLIYYISGGVNVPVAKTNAFGEAVVDFHDIPAGTTLYSSIAKDPDNLNNPYTKAFSPVNGKFHMMPDGEVLYWYGRKSNNLEEMNSANGWSPSPLSFAGNITYNPDNIYVTSPNGINGVGSKNKIDISYIHYVIKPTNMDSDHSMNDVDLGVGTAKNRNGDLTRLYATGNTLQHVTNSTPISGEGYMHCDTLRNCTCNIYAIWGD